MILFYRLNRFLVMIITTFVNKVIMKCSGILYGSGLHTCGLLFLRNYAGKGGISIGRDVNINSCGMANPVGGCEKTYLFAGKNAKISIGDRTGLSNSIIFSSNRIEIGSEVTIGAGCKIYDTDFHSINPDCRLHGNSNVPTSPIRIGDRVFLGGNVTVLKGVVIGEDSVVGAGSVVTHNIPSKEVWAGNPAKFIKKL